MNDIDINTLQFDIDWPIIGRFKDELFPYNGYDHIRYTARAIIENENNEFGFLHLVGEDFFGVRDHLESCGGGLEENEDLVDTIIREVKEEMGLSIKHLKLLGSIIDTYNLINRITLSTFFYCNVDTTKQDKLNRTYEEQILIKEIVWLKKEDAIKRLKEAKSNVDILVQRRDLLALEYYLNKQ